MRVFGIRIDNLPKKEILATAGRLLDEPKFHRIATINPEFLLAALENERFNSCLNASDLNIADGAGLHLAFWKQKQRLLGRFPGADLMLTLISLAEQKRLSVFLVARQDGLSTWKAAAAAIKRLYPKLHISGTFAHPQAKDIAKTYEQAKGYDIVFCNFGAPEQEYFLEGLREQPGRIRLAMGVGGSFDYISGKAKRAPRWMRAVGLEWLWRLIRQPKRWKRIRNAVFVFSWRVVFRPAIYWLKALFSNR